MGLQYYKQRLAQGSNQEEDGLVSLSPAIEAQIALIDGGTLSEAEKDVEIMRLEALITDEMTAILPSGSAIDMEAAMEDGRFNPWDNRPTTITFTQRVMLWKAQTPNMPALDVPVIGDCDKDSVPCACDRGDKGVLCYGRICALIKKGSSVNQVKRAKVLSAAWSRDMAMIVKVSARVAAKGLAEEVEWIEEEGGQGDGDGEYEEGKVEGSVQLEAVADDVQNHQSAECLDNYTNDRLEDEVEGNAARMNEEEEEGGEIVLEVVKDEE